MENDTRNRLVGLNHLLIDLFGPEVLISTILSYYGYTKDQVDKIRKEHLDAYLLGVSRNIYSYIRNVQSKEGAELIRFWYYLDGKAPDQNSSNIPGHKPTNENFNKHKTIVLKLKDKKHLDSISDILSYSAKPILAKSNSPEVTAAIKEYRLGLIKKSAEKLKRKRAHKKPQAAKRSKKKTPRRSVRRPPNCMTEAEKKRQSRLSKNYSPKQMAPVLIDKPIEPRRIMFNPWLGSERKRSNWW